MTTLWHFLCGTPGTLRICNTCARNPLNQPAAAKDTHQHWSNPALHGDQRCGDWMARREVVK